ncbi:MAG: endonuclease/exonuclease/phosphatase family protein [Caldilineae bacterium]|nr:MAG: endonuclease/exonuclease/phosphatase family protein [Caldilineae bacterium]
MQTFGRYRLAALLSLCSMNRRLLPAALLPLLLLLFWLSQVSRPAGRVEGCTEGCAQAADGSPGLRVLSLNMLHGFPAFTYLPQRVELIATEIEREGADIVLLQEVPWTREGGNVAGVLAGRLGYNYVYARANGNRLAIFFEEGEAILSRYPLRGAEVRELSPRAGIFEHRVVLHAVAVTPRGGLDLFVTHLTNGKPEVNRGQAETLLAFVEERRGGPALVAGDFNATPDSPQLLELTQMWQDTALAAPDSSPLPTCCVEDLTAGPNEVLEKRIDYVFMVDAGSLHLRRAERAFDEPSQVDGGWLWPSDHVGLFLEFGYDSETGARGRRTVKIDPSPSLDCTWISP